MKQEGLFPRRPRPLRGDFAAPAHPCRIAGERALRRIDPCDQPSAGKARLSLRRRGQRKLRHGGGQFVRFAQPGQHAFGGAEAEHRPFVDDEALAAPRKLVHHLPTVFHSAAAHRLFRLAHFASRPEDFSPLRDFDADVLFPYRKVSGHVHRAADAVFRFARLFHDYDDGAPYRILRHGHDADDGSARERLVLDAEVAFLHSGHCVVPRRLFNGERAARGNRITHRLPAFRHLFAHHYHGRAQLLYGAGGGEARLVVAQPDDGVVAAVYLHRRHFVLEAHYLALAVPRGEGASREGEADERRERRGSDFHSASALHGYLFLPQHCLYFLPLPQGQGSRFMAICSCRSTACISCRCRRGRGRCARS